MSELERAITEAAARLAETTGVQAPPLRPKLKDDPRFQVYDENGKRLNPRAVVVDEDGTRHYVQRVRLGYASGDRNPSRTHAEQVSRGEHHWTYKDPAHAIEVFGGDNNPSRRHPERLRRGEQNPAAVLQDEAILLIRKAYYEWGWTQQRIADMCLRSGVHISQAEICHIVNNKTWKHIPHEALDIKPQREDRQVHGSRVLTHNGETHSVTEWAKLLHTKYGVSITRMRGVIFNRLYVGWSIEDVLNTPVRTDADTHRFTYNGETRSIAEWAESYGLARQTLSNRLLQHGWSIEDALNIPLGERRKN